MTERQIVTLCLGCLAPCPLPESLVRAAIAGLTPTTFYCDDDLAYIGVRIYRPEGNCGSCQNPNLIVRTRPSLEHWAG